jgi:hypothetical protein
MTSYCVEELESREDLDGDGGGRGEGAGARRGPNGGWGRGRRDVKADVEEERAGGVDQPTVGEAVSAPSRFPWRRSGHTAWT